MTTTSKQLIEKQLAIFLCPRCLKLLRVNQDGALCNICGKTYAIRNDKLFLIEPPKDAPLPRKDDTEALEEKNWSSWRLSCYKHLAKVLLPLSEDKVVIDLGGGRPFYQDIITHFKNFVAVDFYPYAHIRAVADISGRLPIKEGEVDVLILSNVLEHMPSGALTLNESFRLLKSGGLIVAETPFLMSLHSEPYDYNRPTKYLIEKMLTDAGFVNIKIENIGTFFNVYKNMQRDFFHTLLVKFSGNSTRDSLMRILIRVMRKVSALAITSLSSYEESIKSENNPEGYGFSAQKK